MPFKSEKQRKLFYAAANNPKVRKNTGISKKVAEKMISHDDNDIKIDKIIDSVKKLHNRLKRI